MNQTTTDPSNKPDLSANITSAAVTAVELSEYLGITVQRVHQLVAEKIVRKAARGAFDLKPCVKDYCSYLRGVSRGSDDAKTEQSQRTRLTKVRADMAELEHLEKLGVLVVADVRRKQDHSLAVILKNNLQSIPDRVAPIIAAESDPVEVHKLITTEVRNSLDAVIKDMESTEVDDATLDISRRDALEAYKANQELVPEATD